MTSGYHDCRRGLLCLLALAFVALRVNAMKLVDEYFMSAYTNAEKSDAEGVISADEVSALPGWNGKLPSKWYAGYISAGSDTRDGVDYKMQMHYIFIESENNPSTDPVVVWTNGG